MNLETKSGLIKYRYCNFTNQNANRTKITRVLKSALFKVSHLQTDIDKYTTRVRSHYKLELIVLCNMQLRYDVENAKNKSPVLFTPV
jgi:hypothetical protein